MEEATIAEIHAALQAKRITCRALVEQYLRRIEAYDKNGPALNAIVQVNPEALKQAAAIDARGASGPLHCVPMIVKDNFETIGLQSANGSLALAGFVSAKDAFQVKRVKEAGAIVLAKSNMAEWAFTPYETLSSILPGYTKNPYALDRVTAGGIQVPIGPRAKDHPRRHMFASRKTSAARPRDGRCRALETRPPGRGRTARRR